MKYVLPVISAFTAAWMAVAQTARDKALERKARLKEARAALHLDEAAWEARRYERRRTQCNYLADLAKKLNYPTNAVSFSVDFRTGDIRVEFADGSAYVQRYEPGKEPVVVRPGAPRKVTPELLEGDNWKRRWNPPFRTRPKQKVVGP
jgi:hypothetical protein